MNKNQDLTDDSSKRNKDLNNFLTVQFFASKDSINFNNNNLNEDFIFIFMKIIYLNIFMEKA